MPKNDGTAAQDLVRDALMLMERGSPTTFLRLYDSKSAGIGKGGNFIPEQPADFLYLVNGQCVLLEVKSSDHHASLADATLRSVFSESQVKGARLWMRAGGIPICAFYSVVTKQFEYWDMIPIVAAYLKPPRQRKINGNPFGYSSNHPKSMASILFKPCCKVIYYAVT